MNSFVNAINPTTANGAVTLATSKDVFVDLFSMIGSCRNHRQDAVNLFRLAFSQDRQMAMRILLWVRDCRGGAGERAIFGDIISYLQSIGEYELLNTLAKYVPEFGRFDDYFVFLKNKNTAKVTAELIKKSILAGNNLAAKWMPREKSANKDIAKILQKQWKMSSKEYRKYLVERTNVIETQMCNKEFDKIIFKHVPSLAMARYTRAFGRNAPEKFAEYKDALKSGEVVAKATSLFPHDVIRSVNSVGYGEDYVVQNAQWNSLENYVPSDVSILPIVDVSGSMRCLASGAVTCMDVAVGLGIYLSERQSSAFRGSILTFTEKPSLFKINPEDSIEKKVNEVLRFPWGMSTDFVAAMRLILQTAVTNNVPAEEMPDYLLLCSDMEFNMASKAGDTNFEQVKAEFESVGYKLPKLIFWQLNGRANNIQVAANQVDTAMVSGFSTSILTAVLSGNTPTPESIMYDAIMKPRYEIEGVTV